MSETCSRCRKEVNNVVSMKAPGFQYTGPLCIPCFQIVCKNAGRMARAIRRLAEQLPSAHIRS